MPAPSSVAPAVAPAVAPLAPVAVGDPAAHPAGVATDLVHDVALRLLGDERGAARVTTEVLLRAIGRAADGDAVAMSTTGLLRAVVRHADVSRATGVSAPTTSGATLLARTVQRDGRRQERAAVAASALTLDLDALVTLDLCVRHRLDDRSVAAVLGRPRAEVATVLDGALVRVARAAQVDPSDARSLYRSLTLASAPDEVHATVAAAAHRHPTSVRAHAGPVVAWAVAALVVIATLLGLANLVSGWGAAADAELQVAVATALIGEVPSGATDLARTATTASLVGDRSRASVPTDVATPSFSSDRPTSSPTADPSDTTGPTEASVQPSPGGDEASTDDASTDDASSDDASSDSDAGDQPDTRPSEPPAGGPLAPLLPGA